MGDLAAVGGGTALAAAGLPRLVTLPDGRTHRVRPPTVRDALEVLTALPGAVAGDEGDQELLLEALTRWLPDEVLSWLLVLEASAHESVLRGLLFQGADLERLRRRAKRRQGEDGEDGPAQIDWRLALADYCQVYHAGNPWVVYQVTPWPFFLAFLEVSGAASARELIRWVELEVLPHMGKGIHGALNRLQARARDAQPGDGHGSYASPEVIARDREELRRRFGAGGQS